MAKRIQSFKHTETAYNRPNHDWSCGRECEGISCALGPDVKGNCRAGYVSEGACRPENSAGRWSCTRREELGGTCRQGPRADGSCCLARKAGQCIPARGQYNKLTRETTNQDRWFCTRDSSRGGACGDGPLPDGSCCLQVLPCRPKASLRRARGTFTVLVSALTLAVVLLLFARNPESLAHPLNPGPVNAVHSTADITCAKCHADSAVGLSDLASFHGHDAFTDGKLCLECHLEIGRPGEARVFFPHTMPRHHLSKLTAKAEEKAGLAGSDRPLFVALAASFASALGEDQSSIACASCHREHGGRHVDLKSLSNHQCQVCHTGQFHGFSDGHPEFTAYPYRRRTRIFFDHETHFRQYFKSETRIEGTEEYADDPNAKSCADCHEPDPQGGMMLTRSYEQTCSACHDPNTRDGSWDVVTFPRMRLSRLADHLDEDQQAKLDAWNSSGKANEISPLLRFWLADTAGDDTGAIPASIYVSRNDDPATKMRAAETALEIHEGFFAAEKNEIADWLLSSSWLGGAPGGTRRRLGEDLAEAFADLRRKAQESAGDENAPPVVTTGEFGGTYTYERETGTFSYRPGGHADPVLKAVLDHAASKARSSDVAKRLLADASGYELGFDTDGAGRCLKCHTLDEAPDGTMTINWRPAPDDPAARPITRFNHRTHFDLPEILEDSLRNGTRYESAYGGNSCAACHIFRNYPANEEGRTSLDAHLKGYRELFSGSNRDPHKFRSGFEELDHASCVECHTPDKAGDSCLLCHRYHATPLPMAPPLPPAEPVAVTPPDAATPSESPDQKDAMPDSGPGDGLLPGGGEDKGDGGGLLPGGGEDKGDGGGLLPGGGEDKGDGGGLLPGGGEDKGDDGGLLPGGGEDKGDDGGLLPGGGEDKGDGGGLLPGGGEDKGDDGGLLPGGGEDKGDGGGLLPGGGEDKGDGGGLLPGGGEDKGDDGGLLPGGGEDKGDGGGLLPGGGEDKGDGGGLLPGGGEDKGDGGGLLPGGREDKGDGGGLLPGGGEDKGDGGK